MNSKNLKQSRQAQKLKAPPKNFQILSLDGGGIKGIFSAAVLACLEDDLNIRIVDHFDLIAGTSTGGIIAIALALGIRPKDILDFYVSKGPLIFPKSFLTPSSMHLFRRKYSAAPLEHALKSIFGEKKFGECTKRLVITSYNLGEDDVYLFRTPHHEKLRRDYRLPAWQVARATSAAPTYFPSAKNIDNIRLIDGGIWANNPSLVGITEAVNALSVPLASLSLLSIGTTEPIIKRPSRLDNGGVIAWARGSTVVELIMRSQSISIDNQARMLLSEGRYFRINPQVTDKEFSLDDIKKAQSLISKASHFTRKFTPVFTKTFQKHKASIYQPIY